MFAGYVTNRSGDPFKPSAIRAYEKDLRLRVLPVLGHLRLREVRPRDVNDSPPLIASLAFDGDPVAASADPATPMDMVPTAAAANRRGASVMARVTSLSRGANLSAPPCDSQTGEDHARQYHRCVFRRAFDRTGAVLAFSRSGAGGHFQATLRPERA